MARLDRNGRLNRRSRDKINDALLAELDFVNGVYSINRLPTTIAAILGNDATIVGITGFAAGNVVAGSGMSRAAGSSAAFIGDLLTIFTAGCTIITDVYMPAGAFGFSFDSAEAGAYQTEMYCGQHSSGANTGRCRIFRKGNGSTAWDYTTEGYQAGENRVAITFDQRGLFCSLNGAESVGGLGVVGAARVASGGFFFSGANLGASIIRRMRFFKPVLDLEVLQQFSRN